MRNLILLTTLSALLLLSPARARPATIDFAAGNVTNADDGDFAYRFNTMVTFGKTIMTISLSAQAKQSPTSTDVKANTLIGMASADQSVAPWASLMFANGAATVTPGGAPDFQVSMGFMGFMYMELQEVDAAGSVVTSTQLKDLAWAMSAKTTSGKDDALQSADFSAAVQTTGKITITYVVSNIVGILAYGDAVVSPQTLEMIVEIESYPYKAAGNHLVLQMLTAHGKATAVGKALVSTAGDVYVTFNTKAKVNGADAQVTISEYAAVTFPTDQGVASLKAALDLAIKGGWSCSKVSVSFPAGANSIIYDPALGRGYPVYGASSFRAPAAALLFLAALLLCLL